MKGEEGPQNGEDKSRLPAKRPPGEITELDSDPEAQESVPGQLVEASWSGPLPPPGVLRAFGEAVPGADVAILEEFRNETEHRRKIEDRESRSLAFTSATLSLSIGSTPLVAVVAGVVVAALGYPWPGFALILGPIAVDASMKLVVGRPGKGASSGQLDTEELDPKKVTDGKE